MHTSYFVVRLGKNTEVVFCARGFKAVMRGRRNEDLFKSYLAAIESFCRASLCGRDEDEDEDEDVSLGVSLPSGAGRDGAL